VGGASDSGGGAGNGGSGGAAAGDGSAAAADRAFPQQLHTVGGGSAAGRDGRALALDAMSEALDGKEETPLPSLATGCRAYLTVQFVPSVKSGVVVICMRGDGGHNHGFETSDKFLLGLPEETDAAISKTEVRLTAALVYFHAEKVITRNKEWAELFVCGDDVNKSYVEGLGRLGETLLCASPSADKRGRGGHRRRDGCVNYVHALVRRHSPHPSPSHPSHRADASASSAQRSHVRASGRRSTWCICLAPADADVEENIVDMIECSSASCRNGWLHWPCIRESTARTLDEIAGDIAWLCRECTSSAAAETAGGAASGLVVSSAGAAASGVSALRSVHAAASVLRRSAGVAEAVSGSRGGAPNLAASERDPDKIDAVRRAATPVAMSVLPPIDALRRTLMLTRGDDGGDDAGSGAGGGSLARSDLPGVAARAHVSMAETLLKLDAADRGRDGAPAAYNTIIKTFSRPRRGIQRNYQNRPWGWLGRRGEGGGGPN
jgi:hypothetical protein